MTPRPIVLAWWIWAVIILAVLAGVLWLSSCATKPVPFCAEITARIVDSGTYGQGYFMDAEDIATLRSTVKGLQAGSCRLKPVGIEI